MGARLRSWWQQIKKHRVAIGVVAIVLIVAITLIIVGYWFDWTGFSGYNKITVAHTISGTNAGTVIRTEEYQPGKGLWDWLNLLGVLAIPAVVGLGAAWYTAQQGKVSDRENTDNQRETTLQQYVDKMSELLIEKRLRESSPEDEVRTIARVRTITVLFQLDARRIGYVFAFLREAGLMSNTSGSIVSLRDANLRKINFSQATIQEIDLRGAKLSEADFSEADLDLANLNNAILQKANLSGTSLNWANLSGANLSDADLSGAFLWSANLSKARLWAVNLSNAELWEVNLSEATLVKADLSKSSLLDADLTRANLREVDFSGASLLNTDLSGADLSGANLTGAILERANLKGVTGITVEQLESQAKSLKGTIMPDGSIHP